MTMSATDDSRPSSGPSTGRQVGAGSSRVSRPAAGLKIRWDRLSIALAGAIALAVALVTSVLAVVGLVSSIVPVIALVLAVASVAVLRTLALRGRRRTPQQDSEATEESASPSLPDAPVVHRPTTLFNAEDTGDRRAEEENRKDDGAEPAVAAPARLTAAELRAAALAVAAEAGEKPVGTGAPWQPVDVPKPTYVEAPKAEREDPAPLDLPEAPKPQAKTPLKNGAVAPQVETPSAPRMNLDDILQRRRA